MRMNDIKNFLQIIIFILASLIGKAILKALKGIGLISHPSKIFKIKNQQLKIQNPIRGIGGVDVTGGAEYLTHVLGEVKAVCVPAAAPPVLWLGKPKGGCRSPRK